ncbi:hypothetical protein [Acetobacter fallax]|uniref:NADH:quinone oxidoreductase/Mrp antiporter membrane subunit domain-containing protein n=2 Tax=Acetobacter fallax TaxID=1737473 RepID=A0ABX0KD45_9PROT|nr:hypothetical protein [Acetobacter fallax]NHO33078.1 hypothetical protein [Acetobacter fallax]
MQTVGTVFLFSFAMTGLLVNARSQSGWRVSLACAAACFAALAVHPLLLATAGAAAQLLVLPSRQRLSAGCLRMLLFVSGCAPGGEWAACIAALTAGCAASRGRGALALAPSVEMGCSLLILIRCCLQSQVIPARQMAFVLLVGGVTLGFGRALKALSTRYASSAFASIFAASHALAVIASGLFLLASAADSPLCGQAALSAFVLDLLCVWPVAVALLHIGDLTVAGGGSDRLNRLGGLILFAPRLAALFAVVACAYLLLPPTGGFSVLWLLAETALGLLPEGYAPALPSIVLLASLGAIVALFSLAVLRLVMLVMLGGPRTPRMAGCTDITEGTIQPILVCLVVTAVTSCVPGLIARLTPRLMGFSLTSNEMSVNVLTAITLVGPDGLSSWTPIAVMLMLLVVAVIVIILRQRARVSLPKSAHIVFSDVTPSEETLWSDGLRTRSSWLPFGEPLLWPGSDAVAAILKQTVLISSASFRDARYRVFKVFALAVRGGKVAIAGIHRIEIHGLAVVLLLTALALWAVTVRP